MCNRCGKCCLNSPCVVKRNLKDRMKGVKFIKNGLVIGEFRPLLNNRGVCKHLLLENKTYVCKLIRDYKVFRDYMLNDSVQHYCNAGDNYEDKGVC